MPTSLTQALEDHLRYRSRKNRPGYVKSCQRYIKIFLRDVRGGNVEDILRIHVNAYLAKNQGYNAHTARSAVREFLRWCRDRYWEHTPQLQPCPTKPSISAEVSHRKRVSRVERAREAAARAAKHMRLPHQKAVFLFGYYHGLSLRRIALMTVDDLRGMPLLHPELYTNLGRITSFGDSHGRLFGEWFGPKGGMALPRWHEWTAPDRIWFSDVRLAGASVMVAAGVRPRLNSYDVATLLMRTLPEVNDETIRRLPSVWGD